MYRPARASTVYNERETTIPKNRSLFLHSFILCAVLAILGTACSAEPPLSPEQQALVNRLESVEELLGRHGWTDDFPYMEGLREEAAALDLPVAEARARLILGRTVAADHARAHLELAAEVFREHDEPGWEALAQLQLARKLRRLHLKDPLFSSGHREEAVRALERSVRLAREAEDPLTAAEAHWVLGAIHRVEDARGPAIEQLERAAEGFEEAGEPLLVVAARIEVARAYESLGNLPQAQAVLEVALADLEGEAGFEELKRLTADFRETRSHAEAAINSKRMAEGLRERGFPEIAAHLDRVAEFFEERGEHLDREGWSPADRRAMQEIMSRAPKPRIEPPRPVEKTRLGATIVPPLDEYMAEHPDQAMVRRAFEIVLRSEIERVDHAIRRLEIDLELADKEDRRREEAFQQLLTRAEETGYMPDLPVEWLVRQIEQAPEKYREPGALPMWVDYRAADVYYRLGRRVEEFRGIPPEDNGSIYHPMNAWQLRYCENLKEAFERVGKPEEYRCDGRNNFHAMADRFTHSVHLDNPSVSQGSRIDALEEKKRRLQALLQDPSRLEDELEDELLADALDGLFYDDRNPSSAVHTAVQNAPLDHVLAVKEVSKEIAAKDRERTLERRIGEAKCLLAQQRTLHGWLARLADTNDYQEQADAHRAWLESLQSKQRQRWTPSGFVPADSPGDAEATLNVGCGGGGPSFIDLRKVEPDSSERQEPLREAWQSLEAGRHREALRTFRAFQEAEIERPELRAALLDGLGRAYLGLGDRRRALEAFRSSVDALEEVVGSFQRASLLATYAGRAAETYGRVIELLVAEGRHREAFEHAERARARAFLHRLGSAPIGPGSRDDVPEVLVRAENDLRRRLVRLENFRRQPGLGPDDRSGEEEVEDTVERRLQSVRQEYARVLQRIGGSRRAGGTLTGATATSLSELQGDLLPRGSVLVEYHLLPERGFAWVVDQSSVRLVTIEAGSEVLETLVDQLRREIAARRSYQHLAGPLYDALAAPVLPHVRGRPAILVPHGPLHHLPFGALWNEEQSRHLAEELTWTTIPSASTLRWLDGGALGEPARPLVLGDPDGTLPAARESARRVARLLGVEPLLEAKATENAFRRRVPEADVLHVEAHARFDDDDPLFSRIVLAPGPEPDAAEADGRLELYEVHELDLRHVDLVTLSACETAVGHRTIGDDVTSLQRAFLAGGADRVVSTLWTVEDKATAAWSQAFYRKLAEGEPVPEALAGAQRELLARDEWRHPYYWAGFVAGGAPG